MSRQHGVYGWGLNYQGQCGVRNVKNVESEALREDVRVPTAIDIPSDADIVSIKCGFSHSGCMSADHEVFLWGRNENNECCGGDEDVVWSPQCVNEAVMKQSKMGRIVDFFLGNYTTMFLLSDGGQ